MATAPQQRDEHERAPCAVPITLAARGLGSTSPNPVVGCVDPRRRRRARRARAGTSARAARTPRSHALRAAGERARGGTALVTLEPCNHTGRTGPCAQALIDAGIARVVYAVADPNPAATGGARRPCARPGSTWRQGLLADEAAAGNAAWLTSVRLGRPHVTWKYAATLDGRIAAADGTSRWITSAEARADVHRLRAECDAVVVGSGTQRADDPHLAVRGASDPAPSSRCGSSSTPTAPPSRPAPASWTAPRPPSSPSPRTSTPAHREASRRSRLPRARGRVWTSRPCSPSCTRAACAPSCSKAARRSPVPSSPPGAVDRVVGYLAPVLLGAGPAALDRRRNHDHHRSVAARRDARPSASAPICASPRPSSRPQGALKCSPESSKSWARSPPSRTWPTPPASALRGPVVTDGAGTATPSPSTASV